MRYEPISYFSHEFLRLPLILKQLLLTVILNIEAFYKHVKLLQGTKITARVVSVLTCTNSTSRNGTGVGHVSALLCAATPLIKLSPNQSKLFLECLNYFITSMPPEHPVVLLMDSHSAHIGAEVLKVAKDNHVYLFTFPAHSTHLLQPLAVGLFKPLKSYWRDAMN